MAKHRRNMVAKVKQIDNVKGKLEENNKLFSELVSDEVAKNRIKEITDLVEYNMKNKQRNSEEVELETYIEITPKSDWRIN